MTTINGGRGGETRQEVGKYHWQCPRNLEVSFLTLPQAILVPTKIPPTHLVKLPCIRHDDRHAAEGFQLVVGGRVVVGLDREGFGPGGAGLSPEGRNPLLPRDHGLAAEAGHRLLEVGGMAAGPRSGPC